MSADNGGFVFPANFTVGNVSRTEGGMTLRDWFAGQALAGFCSNPVSLEQAADTTDGPAWMAKWSYQLADAMLAARAEVAP